MNMSTVVTALALNKFVSNLASYLIVAHVTTLFFLCMYLLTSGGK